LWLLNQEIIDIFSRFGTQCRIKVFGGSRLDTVMGPLPSSSVPYRSLPTTELRWPCITPGECEVANACKYYSIISWIKRSAIFRVVFL